MNLNAHFSCKIFRVIKRHWKNTHQALKVGVLVLHTVGTEHKILIAGLYFAGLEIKVTPPLFFFVSLHGNQIKWKHQIVYSTYMANASNLNPYLPVFSILLTTRRLPMGINNYFKLGLFQYKPQNGAIQINRQIINIIYLCFSMRMQWERSMPTYWRE